MTVRGSPSSKELAEEETPEGETRVLDITVERFGKIRLVKIKL